MLKLPKNIITRFAPTPSGYLHIGNVLSFAITWTLAKQNNGKIVLRIDDIDNTRYRPEYVTDIFETLAFLGLHYNAGPQNLNDFEQNYSQHNRLERYQAILDQLKTKDKLYACGCSRSQINALSDNGLYMRQCANGQIPIDHPNTAWRVKVPENHVLTINDAAKGALTVDLNQTMPDFVVRRKDGVPAYQIASLADDIDMGITLIVRGMDLIDSTAAQLYLASELGDDSFKKTTFLHHPLLKNENGEKLSKSKGDTSVYAMRKKGLKPSDIWRELAAQAGIASANISCANEFADAFDANRRMHNN
jgi:glutamyl/glutaminyl-tRNA synthetase